MNDELFIPSLTLDPEPGGNQPFAAPVPAAPEPPAPLPEESLSPEERKMVEDFSSKINLDNSNQIMQYGAGAQKKMADFSETALDNVRTKDLGEVGDMLSGVVMELRGFEKEEEEKGFLGFFKKSSNRITSMKARYDKTSANIDRICTALEGHQMRLLKDVATLDKLYEMNKVYFKELTMYILAGKKKLKQVQETELPAMRQKAERSGLPEDVQAASDLSAMCNRFEKKLHDLDLTRTISIQMAPQLRLVQNNDTQMAEKIQSTLVNTIPLWKSQMVLSLGIAHSQQALKAQRDVTDMTNELLRKNAEALKMATVETARESERGIVDIDTLRATNESLISTLDEVMRIQQEGRQKRGEAETELRRIEGELKNKLLQL